VKTPLSTYCLALERLVALRDAKYTDAAAFVDLGTHDARESVSVRVTISLVGSTPDYATYVAQRTIKADADLGAALDALDAEFAELHRASLAASA